MSLRLAYMAVVAALLSACTTTSMATNPLQKRWNGKSAGEFFAANGPPRSDRSSGGSTVYNWRGGFVGGRSCTVELIVNKDYQIDTINAISDRTDPKGGPSHCEKTLDAE